MTSRPNSHIRRTHLATESQPGNGTQPLCQAKSNQRVVSGSLPMSFVAHEVTCKHCRRRARLS